MTTVGIIGGLGPESTARFYVTLQELHAQTSQPSRIKTLIHSVPVPYALEQRMLLSNKAISHYLPLLIDAAVALEAAGATLIVMPCNTLHCFIRQIQAAVSVKVLDMLSLVSQHIQNKGFKRIGLLATTQTIASKIYHVMFLPGAVNMITPGKKEQKKLDAYIHDHVVHCNDSTNEKINTKPLIEGFTSLTNKDVDVIVLGCTELTDLGHSHALTPTVNTLTILAQSVVNYVTANIALEAEAEI